MLSRPAILVLCAAFLASSTLALAQKKKQKKEEITQVLELPQDPPNAVAADVSRLVFHVSPLSSKGLLSQQTHDAIKSLLKQRKGAQIVRIRAFVAGSGDLRRVPSIVSEDFTDKRLPIPAVSVVQVGALPMVGAQVQLESIAIAKKATMPHGVAFISGQVGIGGLNKALTAANLTNDSVQRVTCFLNSLEHLDQARKDIAASFPKAPALFVQLRRDSLGDFVECEAVAALKKTPETNPAYTGVLEGRYTQIVQVAPGKVAFTGTQLAFGREPADARLAFERLEKTLEAVGASTKSVVMSHVYPLTNSTAETVRKVRTEFFDTSRPPASTLLLFEGLSSLDASFGIDAVALVR